MLNVNQRKRFQTLQTQSEGTRTHQIARDQLNIHADWGSAMTSKSVTQLMVDLAVGKTLYQNHGPA